MFVFFKDGNKKAEESYYTIHNLAKAKKLSSGKNVKIGIVDWLFGDEKSKLYEGFFDVTQKGFIESKEHGYSMANTLKEIAPNCQLYAINGITKESITDDLLRVEYLRRSVDLAILYDIKILVYSHKEIKDKIAVENLKEVIRTASDNGIITIFLHCNQKNNIMPMAIGNKKENAEAEIFNIYQYDYNALNPVAYNKWLESGKKDKTCFLSWSSMCPVLAGFIALMLEINPKLTKQEIINVLKKTSENNVPNVLNAVTNLIKKGRKLKCEEIKL